MSVFCTLPEHNKATVYYKFPNQEDKNYISYNPPVTVEISTLEPTDIIPGVGYKISYESMPGHPNAKVPLIWLERNSFGWVENAQGGQVVNWGDALYPPFKYHGKVWTWYDPRAYYYCYNTGLNYPIDFHDVNGNFLRGYLNLEGFKDRSANPDIPPCYPAWEVRNFKFIMKEPIDPNQPNKYKIKIIDEIGNEFIDTGEGEPEYDVMCGDDCLPGMIKCAKSGYPGYCCLSCKDVIADIKTMQSMLASKFKVKV